MGYYGRIKRMFLELVNTLQHIIEYILCFINDNSTLMGVLSSVIAGSLWFKKYINQKRAEAFFGFYTKLSLLLKSLQIKLEENGQLNISDSNAGNIYSLIYVQNYIKTACPGYRVPTNDELDLYKSSAKELKDILFNNENNVYPRGAKQKEWYESQQIIYLFCEFIENEAYQHITNEAFVNGENESKHIIKCRLLVNAINNIQEAINQAKY